MSATKELPIFPPMRRFLTYLAGILLSFPLLSLGAECPDVSYKISVAPDGIRAEEIPLRRGLREEGFKSWKDVMEKQESVRASVQNEPRISESVRTEVLGYLDRTLANTRCWADRCPTNTTDPDCVFYSAAPALKVSLGRLKGTWKLVATSQTETGLRSTWNGPSVLWYFSGNKVKYSGRTDQVEVKYANFIIKSASQPIASIERHTSRWLIWKDLRTATYYHLERVK